MAPRNRALDPRGLESPDPVFKTLILSLVSFSQTVCRPFRSLPAALAAADTPAGLQPPKLGVDTRNQEGDTAEWRKSGVSTSSACWEVQGLQNCVDLGESLGSLPRAKVLGV